MSHWNSSLETGHPHIDAEHQEFFRRLDAVSDAIEQGQAHAQIIELTVILQKYTLGHFSREEAYMHRVKCPALTANRCAHKEFARRLECWLTLLTAESVPASLLADIQHEASTWIQNHILGIDCQLRGCRREKLPRPVAP